MLESYYEPSHLQQNVPPLALVGSPTGNPPFDERAQVVVLPVLACAATCNAWCHEHAQKSKVPISCKDLRLALVVERVVASILHPEPDSGQRKASHVVQGP